MHVFGATQGKSSSVITITASESVCAFCNQRERVSSGLGREWVVSLLLFFSVVIVEVGLGGQHRQQRSARGKNGQIRPWPVPFGLISDVVIVTI